MVLKRTSQVSFLRYPTRLQRSLRCGVLVLGLTGVALVSAPSATAVSPGVGYTCSPSGNIGCFRNGSWEIRHFTWLSGDTQPVLITTTYFNNAYSIRDDFEGWRNRFASGSRAFYLGLRQSSLVPACYRLKYDSRTWVGNPTGSAFYNAATSDSPNASQWGSCVNV
jgi:hypothetical protein